MRKKWSMEQRLRGQNQRAKQAGARHDLTIEQWLETLEYFEYKCAYCSEEYEVIEHYLPVRQAGTTVSNCIPACLHCNIMKDRKNHDLSFYQNKNVIQFIESKGVKISFHLHNYMCRFKSQVQLCRLLRGKLA
jgi:5-methylcytosine-specific restriction endonuclease McrA